MLRSKQKKDAFEYQLFTQLNNIFTRRFTLQIAKILLKKPL